MAVVDEFLTLTQLYLNFRCLIPECDTPNPDFSPWWLDKAVPITSTGALDGCQRYGSGNSSAMVVNGTCSPELFDIDIVLACDDYVYENTNTVVYDVS